MSVLNNIEDQVLIYQAEICSHNFLEDPAFQKQVLIDAGMAFEKKRKMLGYEISSPLNLREQMAEIKKLEVTVKYGYSGNFPEIIQKVIHLKKQSLIAQVIPESLSLANPKEVIDFIHKFKRELLSSVIDENFKMVAQSLDNLKTFYNTNPENKYLSVLIVIKNYLICLFMI